MVYNEQVIPMVDIKQILSLINNIRDQEERPRITLSYTQSLDGCITSEKNRRIQPRSEESALIGYQLRIHHDAFLVGIGTILNDDPQLTEPSAEGTCPQPVILDSQLRFPLAAKLLQHERKPWIFTNDRADINQKEALQSKGAYVLRAKADEKNQIDLHYCLRELTYLGIKRLLVEGGAKIITGFINQHLIDAFVIIITPVFAGGLHPFETILKESSPVQSGISALPGVQIAGSDRCGNDLILWGHFLK